MREIKFREWVDGRMRYFDIGQQVRSGIVGLQELPIMQYTGLKDKNGKEIYEGDIIAEWEDGLEKVERYQVKWHGEDGYPAFDIEPNHFEETNALSFYAQNGEGYELEVIGNIYENPELLQQ